MMEELWWGDDGGVMGGVMEKLFKCHCCDD